MMEKYYREALGQICDYASEKNGPSGHNIHLAAIKKMALDALHGCSMNRCTAVIHGIKKLGGFSICPDCGENFYPNDIEEG